MNIEQKLIASCREAIALSVIEDPERMFDTAVGWQRYQRALGQYELETRFKSTWRAMLVLSQLLQGDPGNKTYSREYWDREAELQGIFEKLRVLEYEKKIGPACCPLLNFVEESLGEGV